MDIFSFNLSWMAYNLYLAVLPVIFAWFLFKMPNKLFTVIVGFLWLLYLPNTIYVFTDLHHLVEQWTGVDLLGKGILIIQYTLLEVIGLLCFLIAFYPVEKILRRFHLTEKQIIYSVIVMNFLMGYALVVGKFERVNSWDVFLNPGFVISSTIQVLSSYQMVGLIILFSLFSNFFYFLFRERAKKLYAKWVI
jgi:uncharacterized membrane protein